jgi:hypothetical protein
MRSVLIGHSNRIEFIDKRANSVSKKRLYFGVILSGVLLLGLWNATVYIPVFNALSDEKDTSTIVYRRWLVSPSEIVFDVRSVAPTVSMAEIDRRLFKSAEALKDRSYSNVVLAYRGNGKFLLNGAQFKAIGETRTYQNPIYTIRTLPENVTEMDGTPAFETWTGGWLGVVGKQFEDHNELHAKWWAREALGFSEGSPIN